MKVLLLAGAYPHAGHPFSGVFNERCAQALHILCDHLEVLVPRPYVPPLLSSLVPRWKSYAHIAPYELRDGVSVYRPAYIKIPGLNGAFADPGLLYWYRRTVRSLHRHVGFDAIISFNLLEAGGLAWRVGRDLRIVACGWATGDDVRYPRSTPFGRMVKSAIDHLDLVFYQSQELLERAAELLGTPLDDLVASDRHIVLPRGIPEPPSVSYTESRSQVRSALGITEGQILALTVGRIVRDKGVFELLRAISLAATRNPNITCALVGSNPAYDETIAVQRWLDQDLGLKARIKLLPACNPEEVWEYLCAADIFAFASHHEGMPNSLLEAMAMGVPAVAFAIPPVREIEAGKGGILAVPPLDSVLFSEAILRLAASPEERIRIGKEGKARVRDRFMVQRNMGEALLRLSEVVADTRSNSGQSRKLEAERYEK